MKPEPDRTHDVEKLVDLLHKMPHPQPRDVAGKVIEGIKSPRPTGPLTWVQRLGLDFDKQPVLVCASGVVVCSLLIYGLLTALRAPAPRGDVTGLLQDTAGAVPPGEPALYGNPGLPPVASPPDVPSSTAPVLTPNGKPFQPGVERGAKGSYNTVGGGN